MFPDMRLKLDFPGFGSIEIVGEGAEGKRVQELTIKFIPTHCVKDNHGWVIRLSRDGDCYVQEMKPYKEENYDGMGIS